MKHLLLSVIILFLFYSLIYGFKSDINYSVEGKPYDVLHYKLFTSLGMVDKSFNGKMTITLLMTEDSGDSIWFNSLGLTFNSIKINDTSVAFSVQQQNETFYIHLNRFFAAGETVAVEINYFRDSLFQRYNERQGYYWYPRGYQPTVLENIGYTLSEPSDARLWMPCFDDPSDKATCEISIEVPEGYVACSNGLLRSVIDLDSTVVFDWEESYLIATYLMSITASKYSTFSHYYHKVTFPADSVEVKYYIWKQDSSGSSFNAVQAFSKIVKMMEYFSSVFGEYPFEKYGMAAVYPFAYGGMEHQTITTIHRSWLSASAYPFYEDYLAHELAHQWWGDLVTCRSFQDIWLNEGFASYSEALWKEKEIGISAYEQKMRSFLTFDRTWEYSIFDPVGQNQPLFGSSVYHKGAWVLHMLRYLLGDSDFFKSLRIYRNNNGYMNASTADFNSAVNTASGSVCDWFFNQWIYGPGWPVYSYNYQWNDSTAEYDLHLMQVQSSYPHFKMPVEVQVWYGGKNTIYTVWDSLCYQIFPLQANIDSIKFDPRNRILKQIQPWSNGADIPVEVPDKIELGQNYPNPFNPTTKISFRLGVPSFTTLKIYDLFGREVTTLVTQRLEAGEHEVEWNAEQHASGVYFYKLQAGRLVGAKKMLLIR